MSLHNTTNTTKNMNILKVYLSNVAQNASNAITNPSGKPMPLWSQVKSLQLDYSNCYDEMLEQLQSMNGFNKTVGLTREAFSMGSLNEYGYSDGEFFTEYGLNPLIQPDKFTNHIFEDDDEWKELFARCQEIEGRANKLGVELIFNNLEHIATTYCIPAFVYHCMM